VVTVGQKLGRAFNISENLGEIKWIINHGGHEVFLKDQKGLYEDLLLDNLDTG